MQARQRAALAVLKQEGFRIAQEDLASPSGAPELVAVGAAAGASRPGGGGAGAGGGAGSGAAGGQPARAGSGEGAGTSGPDAAGAAKLGGAAGIARLRAPVREWRKRSLPFACCVCQCVPPMFTCATCRQCIH